MVLLPSPSPLVRLSSTGVLLRSSVRRIILASGVHRTELCAGAGGSTAAADFLVLLSKFELVLPLCQRMSGRLAAGSAPGATFLAENAIFAAFPGHSLSSLHHRLDLHLLKFVLRH